MMAAITADVLHGLVGLGLLLAVAIGVATGGER